MPKRSRIGSVRRVAPLSISPNQRPAASTTSVSAGGLGALGVQVVLLHCYPYHREAAYLADVLPNVSFDLGLALTYAGASAGRIISEAMEVAPFTKQLYSSDGFGAAELHYLGAQHFRAGLARALGGWIGDGACTLPEAERIATLIASENSRRIYPLG